MNLTEKLNEISKRCGATTPGPGGIFTTKMPKDKLEDVVKAFRSSLLRSIEYDGGHDFVWVSTKEGVVVGYFGNGPRSLKNAEFWAHCKDDMPLLLELVNYLYGFAYDGALEYNQDKEFTDTIKQIIERHK